MRNLLRMVAEAEGLAKSYGAKQVFKDVRFRIDRNDRVALVGVNGAGKSTLIRMLIGAEELREQLAALTAEWEELMGQLEGA